MERTSNTGNQGHECSNAQDLMMTGIIESTVGPEEKHKVNRAIRSDSIKTLRHSDRSADGIRVFIPIVQLETKE
jgi:streptogramin lyase